jgi:hypothetical protein
MAHYSSQLLYLEDELKNSLEGISVKPLVSASYAQFGVDAGDEDIGRLIMAYESRPTIMETDYCGYSIRQQS